MMDIQAEKIELAKLILSTNDIGIIKKVKALFKSKDKSQWNELPPDLRKSIDESIEQADKGEFITLDKVKEEISVLFKK